MTFLCMRLLGSGQRAGVIYTDGYGKGKAATLAGGAFDVQASSDRPGTLPQAQQSQAGHDGAGLQYGGIKSPAFIDDGNDHAAVKIGEFDAGAGHARMFDDIEQ